MNITIKRRKGDNPLAKLFAGPPSVESEAEYRKLMIVEELLALMAEKGVSRSELAKRMEVQPSRVTSMLTGANNFTIETLVRAGRAVDARLHQHFVPDGHTAHFSTCREDEIHDAFKVKAVKVPLNRVEFKLGPKAAYDDADAA
ncbi:MAG: hypothetical protein H7A48_02240 [Akkermansiaceae bacterium]|nr:hypothetical protein [Akkermansiaceae bacterium]